MAAGGNIVPEEKIFSTDIVYSVLGQKTFVCTSRWEMEGLLHPEFLAVHPIYLLEAEDNIPPS